MRAASSLLALAGALAASGAVLAQTGAWHGPDPAPAAAKSPAASAEVLRRFEPPTVQGLVVDQCESWSSNCVDGGAKAFCRLRGYERVVGWEHAKPGRTWVIGSARECTGDFCTGYRYVECAGLLPVTAPGTRRFQPALANGLPVDNCETWSKNCGAPGAHAFCRSQGYGRALQWEFNRPGRTWVLGSNRACEGDACIGFTYVVCAEPGR